MSSVTISGSSAWICFSASSPCRAVPTTRNSPLVDRISLTNFRMNALSSTTRTVRWLEDTLSHLERLHHHVTVGQVEVDAAPVLAARVRRDEWNLRQAEHAPGRLDVALAHVDASGRKQRGEHAGAADDLGHGPTPRAALPHRLQQHGDGGGRKLRPILAIERQALAGQENVREPANARRAIVEHDRDARPQPYRRDDRVTGRDGIVGDLD